MTPCIRFWKTLSGHDRTPWVLTFDPSHSHILYSGSLDGKVCKWNIYVRCTEVHYSEHFSTMYNLPYSTPMSEITTPLAFEWKANLLELRLRMKWTMKIRVDFEHPVCKQQFRGSYSYPKFIFLCQCMLYNCALELWDLTTVAGNFHWCKFSYELPFKYFVF